MILERPSGPIFFIFLDKEEDMIEIKKKKSSTGVNPS